MTQQYHTPRRRRGTLKWFSDLAQVFAREWSILRKDMGALIFFVLLPFAYPVVYTLIYNPEIVTKLPVAVVDNSRTAASRQLVRDASASPSIEIYGYCNDLNEARELMAQNKVFGIMEIPRDYWRNVERGNQSTVSFYAQTSLLLRYRAFISALSDLNIKIVQDVTAQRIDEAGLAAFGVGGLPVESHNNFLGDPGQGFASFVMPGIVILILQQSMVLGICLLAGTSRERRRRNGGIDPLEVRGASVTATIWGKALCYFVLYIPMAIYVVRFIPEMFALPHQGNPVDYLLFLVPLLLASAMFGLTLQGMCTERESTFLVVVFTSVVFLFLSGLTWPRYAMNGFFVWLGNLIPATWGVEGFIRINSNGATLAQNIHPYLWMWGLAAVYFVTSIWVISRQRHYLTYPQPGPVRNS